MLRFINSLVGMTGVEPAWASSQNWWVAVTLHPDMCFPYSILKNKGNYIENQRTNLIYFL